LKSGGIRLLSVVTNIENYEIFNATACCYQFIIIVINMVGVLINSLVRMVVRPRGTVTLELAVYRQSVLLGDKRLETHDQ
jgi:hypothetical protein